MSTTKNLGLFKHDNPSTNTDIFDVDKALNQNWDKTDEAIGQDRDRLDLLEASNTIYNFKGKVDTLANLQLKTKTEGDVWYCEEDSTYYAYTGTDWIPVNLNLKLGVIDELKAKTIKCLQEVETPTPVSGTSIDLSDSADAKITELKISGNSVQNGEATPDTPVEVESCGDNINLYNAPYRENNKLIITATQDDYYKILSYYAYLEAGKKYRVSFESDGSYGMDSGTDTIQIFLMKDKSFDTMITIFSKNEIISPTVSGNYYIRADVNKNGKSHSFWNFKIKKGTTASPYSPYGQGCINEVIATGNLLKLNDVEETSRSGITYTCKDGIITLNGTCTSAMMITFDEAFLINPNTYTLSSNFEGKVNGTVGQYLYDYNSTGNIIFDGANITWGPATKTLTSQKKVNYGIWIQSGAVLNNLVIKPQLEFGTVKTQWKKGKSQTHTIPTQQPFRAIGDIRDTFIKKNNKWYERHYINRLILNGTESWEIIGTNTTGKYRFQTKVSPNEIVNNQDGDTYMQGFCNRLIMGTPNTTYLCQTGITTLSGYLIIYNEKATDTIDNFKAWLSSNNLTVDYLLKTPIDIECTEEQSTILFDIEQNAKTYNKVTHMYSIDNVSSYKEVTYKKDIETLFENTLVS